MERARAIRTAMAIASPPVRAKRAMCRPGMKREQRVGQVWLVGAVERARRAEVNAPHDRGVHIRIGVAEQTGPDAHRGHVDEVAAVEVGHLDAVGFGEIRRPMLQRVHLRAFAEELGAAGDPRFGVSVEGMSVLAGRFANAEDVAGVGAEDPLDFGVRQARRAAGLPQGEQRFDPDQRRLGMRFSRGEVDVVIQHPEKPVGHAGQRPRKSLMG